MQDYYEILGVPRDASVDDIKKAFHILAHKYHPHKGGDEKKFKEVNEAYQVLSNKEKRAQYDKFGKVFEQGAGQGAGAESDFTWAWGRPSSNSDEGFNFDFEDLGEMFESFFGAGQTQSRRGRDVKKGKDIKIDIEIPLEETLAGVKKIITLRKSVVCSRCSGTGAEPGSKIEECFSCRGAGRVQQIKRTFLGSFTTWAVCPECGGEGKKPKIACNVCKGEGRIKGEEDIDILIPAGVDTNQIIKIAGKGEAGRRGARAGDLYVRVAVLEHPVFKRRGDDLYTQVPVSFGQAALGDEVEISTLEKTKLLLKITAGTESGKVVRISGRGIPHFGGYGRGNLFVELSIQTPKKLTKKQKELLEKLKEEGL